MSDEEAEKAANGIVDGLATNLMWIIPGGKIPLIFKTLGIDCSNGLLEGLQQKYEDIHDWVDKAVSTISYALQIGFASASVWLLRIVQKAVNGIIGIINKLIDKINQFGEQFGIHVENIKEVDFADNYEKEMKKLYESANEGLSDILETTNKHTDAVTKKITDSWGLAEIGYNRSLEGMNTSTEENLGNIAKTTEEQTEKAKESIGTNFFESKNSAVGSLIDLKTEAEKKFSEVSNSKELAEVKNKIQWALDNSQKARELGEATSSGFQNGIFANLGPDKIGNFVSSNVRGAFDLKNSAYYWGSDMVEGYKNGIESKKRYSCKSK